jgi:hypothetical protein
MQVGQQFAMSQAPTEDKLYSQGKSMLNNLGLQKYEKNLKKGLLTDSTLPLLNDRYVPPPLYLSHGEEVPATIQCLNIFSCSCGIGCGAFWQRATESKVSGF